MTTPITQYSRIQHRRGLLVDLPNPLHSSEVGHALDARRLFIGNGELIEGASELGNTEIITDFTLLSNTTALRTIYRSNIVDGINPLWPQTGATVNTPVVRGVGERLDDLVNVKDFGAKGDGIADDTAAINRALRELFTVIPSIVAEEMAYRGLFFPAGRYKVSDYVYFPTNAKIFGEGSRRSIIIMSNVAKSAIIKTADSKFQNGANLGDGGALYPKNIHVYEMGFKHVADQDIIHLELVSSSPTDTNRNIYFEDCLFEGAWISGPSASAAIYVNNLGLSGSPIENVKFVNCHTTNTFYGVLGDIASYQLRRFHFDKCDFSGHNYGFHFYDATLPDPKFADIRISDSYFTTIEQNAIHVGNGHDFISSNGNTFRNCGLDGSDVLFTNFGVTHFSSVSDVFINNIGANIADNGTNSVIINNTDNLVFRNIALTPLMPAYAMAANQTNQPTGYEFDITRYNTAFIDYTIKCFNDTRVGRIFITSDGTISGTVIGDQYTETNPIGIVFSANLIIGSKIELQYSSLSDTSLTQPSKLNLQAKLWFSDFS